MRVGQIVLHAVAFAALGAACMAQTSTDKSSMGQEQQSTAQHGETGAPSSMSHASTQNNTKSPDHAFITKAAQGGLAEVTFGNLAEKNGSSDAVKQFGNKMVTDHSKANDELKQIAQQKGIALPSNLNSKDKRVETSLESKHGPAFDKAYTRDMVTDHEADIAEFRKEAEYGKDPEMKAWAQKTLPMLEQHLQMAKKVSGEVVAESTKKSPGAMSSHQ